MSLEASVLPQFDTDIGGTSKARKDSTDSAISVDDPTLGDDLFRKVGNCKNANFPKDSEGRVYHLGVKRGEVCNRVISVGDPNRAKLLAEMLDSPKETFARTSNRGFTVFTGKFKKVPVTIIATGMGFPMMDFVVRETRAIVDGPMIFIRLGTCGTPREDVPVGSIIVASKGSNLILRNVDSFVDGFTEEPIEVPSESGSDCGYKAREFYNFTKCIKGCSELSALLVKNLHHNEHTNVREGMNSTADTFFASQGRSDENFDDKNETLLPELLEKCPESMSVEMETFHLFHLSRCSRPRGSIRAAAACIVVANRATDDFIDNESLRKAEREGGYEVLNTVCSFPMESSTLMRGEHCVWNDYEHIPKRYKYSEHPRPV
eukprot:Nk52_evm78s352 gene=Nk52_evmTU78s352